MGRIAAMFITNIRSLIITDITDITDTFQTPTSAAEAKVSMKAGKDITRAEAAGITS